MIEDEQQLNHSIEQVQRMYRALAELRRRVQPVDPLRYQLMAEGPVEEIRRLRADIEGYLGVFATEQTRAS